jgi:hypothetical protein
MWPHHLLAHARPPLPASRLMNDGAHLILLSSLLQPISHRISPIALSRVRALVFVSTRYSPLMTLVRLLRFLLGFSLFISLSFWSISIPNTLLHSLWCFLLSLSLSTLPARLPFSITCVGFMPRECGKPKRVGSRFPGLRGRGRNLPRAFGCECSRHTGMERISSPPVTIVEEIHPASTPYTSSDPPLPNPRAAHAPNPQA